MGYFTIRVLIAASQWCANPGISNPNPDPNPGTSNPNPAESESTPIFLNPNPNPTASNPNPDSNPADHARQQPILFFLKPNPDSYSLALNPNPDPNPAQKARNPDSNPNLDSDSHITSLYIHPSVVNNITKFPFSDWGKLLQVERDKVGVTLWQWSDHHKTTAHV